MSNTPNQDHIDIRQLSQGDRVRSAVAKDAITDEESAMVNEYFYVVETVASVLFSKKKLPPTVDYNDLLSVGFDGLVKAIRRFNDSKNTQFKTYANIRVRGEMLDFIRKEWRSKASHQHTQMMDDIKSRVGQVLDNELSQSGEAITVTNLMSSLTTSYVMSLEAVMEHHGDNVADKSGAIDSDYELEDEYRSLNTLVGTLVKEERDFIDMFYRKGLSQKAVSIKMNISEATASRLHSRVLCNLKQKLPDDGEH
ncbi:MAG: sigma-70 family RNA polymerase sigma factor [Candidatus Marinamargulisbacteria bacterium]